MASGVGGSLTLAFGSLRGSGVLRVKRFEGTKIWDLGLSLLMVFSSSLLLSIADLVGGSRLLRAIVTVVRWLCVVGVGRRSCYVGSQEGEIKVET
jgi:hypothetical protein